MRACLVALVMTDALWPYDHGLPGSSVHEIFQARIPEPVAMSFSREAPYCFLKALPIYMSTNSI